MGFGIFSCKVSKTGNPSWEEPKLHDPSIQKHPGLLKEDCPDHSECIHVSGSIGYDDVPFQQPR